MTYKDAQEYLKYYKEAKRKGLVGDIQTFAMWRKMKSIGGSYQTRIGAIGLNQTDAAEVARILGKNRKKIRRK